MTPTERFSDRVADYAKYRPSYPPEVIALLRTDCGLGDGTPVADLGSGTGIFSKLLLDAGAEVFAVEPNAPMREAAEQTLGRNPRFHSIAAPAEVTTLPDASVDLITVAQALHWFDLDAARREFVRILKPGGPKSAGWFSAFWNERRETGTAFCREYEALLREFGTDYAAVHHSYMTLERMGQFFAPAAMQRHLFLNSQTFNFAELAGRLRSSSYAPPRGDARYEPMLRTLEAVFERNQTNGYVVMEYDTVIYVGRISE